MAPRAMVATVQPAAPGARLEAPAATPAEARRAELAAATPAEARRAELVAATPAEAAVALPSLFR